MGGVLLIEEAEKRLGPKCNLQEDEKELKKKIVKFRDDELNHKDIAYEGGAARGASVYVLAA